MQTFGSYNWLAGFLRCIYLGNNIWESNTTTSHKHHKIPALPPALCHAPLSLEKPLRSCQVQQDVPRSRDGNLGNGHWSNSQRHRHLSLLLLQTHKKWFQTTLDPLLPTPHPHPPWEEEHGGSEKRLWAPAIFARKNSGRSRCCSSDVGNARNPLHPSTQCHFGDYQPGISEFLTWDILHIITPPLIQNCGDSLEAFTLPNPKLSPPHTPKNKARSVAPILQVRNPRSFVCQKNTPQGLPS